VNVAVVDFALNRPQLSIEADVSANFHAGETIRRVNLP
jgi:hypothetical protein